MPLGRDRVLLLLAATLATALLSVSAILQKDGRFLLLLAALLYILAVGFALTARTKKPFWGVIGAGILVAGIGGAVYVWEPIRLSLDPDRRAVRLVVDMLEECTRPAPGPAEMQVERLVSDSVTHLVQSRSAQYDYGAWHVNADSREIYAATEAALFLVENNRCAARTFQPS